MSGRDQRAAPALRGLFQRSLRRWREEPPDHGMGPSRDDSGAKSTVLLTAMELPLHSNSLRAKFKIRSDSPPSSSVRWAAGGTSAAGGGRRT